MKWFARVIAVVVIVALAFYAFLFIRPGQTVPKETAPVPHFSHVFVIMMENHSLDAMSPKEAPYIHQLVARYGYDSNYYGVTHVSLPNYVALLSGSTHHTHSDNPDQTFSGPTLVSEMDQHHISWQAVMESLPAAGYTGNWYPEAPGTNPVLMPKNALYGKKHNPFMLFPSLAEPDKTQVVPLRTLNQELTRGQVPDFVWITPNLCNDMHGQPIGSAACPSNQPQKLVAMGDQFLSKMVPEIMHSPAWTGHSVIFITWDEAQMPTKTVNLATWKRWLSAGPGAPRILGIPVGGGSVPLIVIANGVSKPRHLNIWADHYNLLKTIESGFGLPYIGHAASAQVAPLTPFLIPSK
ncbi:alkaline phosphatase family protein [Sulfobacillus harzensis]|uniref:Phosphoesterase n=1 Tax=Sulfobacillus harzensis TaxID=2729629 RepID=A0A7Y0Q333_9FIRM|nr:alkaline phosphatase family protein [Sulfobacillus harzensis]NMP21784.1 phosphoesterase [Sulfobacillus harzensis]